MAQGFLEIQERKSVKGENIQTIIILCRGINEEGE